MVPAGDEDGLLKSDSITHKDLPSSSTSLAGLGQVHVKRWQSSWIASVEYYSRTGWPTRSRRASEGDENRNNEGKGG